MTEKTENSINFPEGWIEQLTPLLGPMLPDFLRSYEAPPLRGVRMRPGLPPIEEAGPAVAWAKDAYELSLASDAGAKPLHEAGAYYLQEPSAMAAAAALKPAPGERVLDLCAAPGGKSTQLAAYMEGLGLLVCNEPVPGRAQILSRNLERMGVKNALAVCALPEELSGKWPGFFDKILVDAPCSGEGMFRRHPETRLEWNAASPAGCAQRQTQILRHAALLLRPGGRLAYSTCTFNATENEGVIQAFLLSHPDFSLVPFHLPGLPESGGMLHLWPHQMRGEGHFVALLQKEGEAEAAAPRKKKGRSEPPLPLPPQADQALALAFLEEHMEDPLLPNALFGGRIVQAPDGLPPLQGVKVLRAGLHLGEIKGRMFAPDHALALYHPSRRSVALTEEEARLYQSGQVLEVAGGLRGFCTPTLNGLALGWGKVTDGQMKNHYPKGLRR